MQVQRLAAAAGIGSVLVAFVEFFGPSFPLTSDPASTVAQHFADHRHWALTAVAAQGVESVLWVVFISGLVVTIVRSGAATAPMAAVITGSGALLNTAISLTGLAAIAATAYRVAATGPASQADGYFIFAAMTLVLSNFMLAAMAAGVALAPLPAWFRIFSAATAMIYLAGGFALANSGAFSPDGSVQIGTYLAELAWTIAASLLILRHNPAKAPSAPKTPVPLPRTSLI